MGSFYSSILECSCFTVLCYDSLFYSTKWTSHTHTSFPLFWISLPVQVPTEHWAVPCAARRFSSGICCAETQSCVRSQSRSASIPPSIHGIHASDALCRFKGMMELQLCLEKAIVLTGGPMNINGRGVMRPRWGLGTAERGQDMSWGKDSHFNRPWRIEHSWASVSSGSNQQRTEYIWKNNSRKFPKAKLEFAVTSGKSLQSIPL